MIYPTIGTRKPIGVGAALATGKRHMFSSNNPPVIASIDTLDDFHDVFIGNVNVRLSIYLE